MEKIITAAGTGMKNKILVPEVILELQNLIRIKRILKRPLDGTCFEAARIPCTKKRQRILIKRMKNIHSWVTILTINPGEALVFTPSLKALEIKGDPLDPVALSRCLDELSPPVWK